MHDPPITPSPSERTFRASSKMSKQRFSNQEQTSNMDAIIRSFREAHLDTCMDQLNNLRASGQEDDPIQNVWVNCLLAAVHLRRLYERPRSYRGPHDEYYADEELASSRQLILEAKREAPKTWQGQWTLGCGLWIASGAEHTNGFEDREEWLEMAEDYIQNAARMYEESRSNASSSSNRSRSDWLRRFDDLQKDINAALVREGYREGPEQQEGAEAEAESSSNCRWKWLDEMYVHSDNSDEPMSSQAAAGISESSTQEIHGHDIGASGACDYHDEDILLDNETIRAQISPSSSSASEQDYTEEGEEQEEEEEADEEDENRAFGNAMDISSSDESSSDNDEDEDDESLSLAREQLNDRAGLESDTDIVAHRAKYVGHCNSRVSFHQYERSVRQ